jgi:predicted alpha/beta superfamily hydrolase
MHDVSSWGGLFTLGVLLNHPETFHNFVASSPSIWWNRRSVLANVPAYPTGYELKWPRRGF